MRDLCCRPPDGDFVRAQRLLRYCESQSVDEAFAEVALCEEFRQNRKTNIQQPHSTYRREAHQICSDNGKNPRAERLTFGTSKVNIILLL